MASTPITTRTPDQAPETKESSSRWWTVLCLFTAVGFLFGATLFRGHSLLFRDAGHFYAPLWQWARSEWGQGRIPLWNPLQNLGVAHFAENSSSVLYPGKLIFALPGPFERWFVVFLAGHVLLAGCTMFRLLRRWKHSSTAAGIAAVSYALSGGILFQYCNPPFLIGAAWLPAAVACAADLLKHRSWGNAARVASVLAIMVLGGDAQTVYHVGLMMVLLAFMLWRETFRAPVTPAGLGLRTAKRGFFHGLVWIGVTAVIGIGLAAVQILPTSQHTAQSQRAAYDTPRSLDELAIDAIQGKRLATTALIGRPAPGSQLDLHHRRAFDFSIGPWRWGELLWPNLSGRWFPMNARWIKAVVAEGRVWSPSLYLGLLPIWLAIGAIRYRRHLPVEGRWIVATTLLAVLGSLGAYGIGWLVMEWHVYRGGLASTAPVGRNIGGLYWLMTVVLPGYVKFRYPAKLWTIATFGLSVLAAMEWDRRQSLTRGKSGWLVFLGLVSLTGLVGVWALKSPIQQTWSSIQIVDSIFGPLDVDAAWTDVLRALGQTALLCLGLGFLLSLRAARSPRMGILVLLVLTIDLIVAHSWMLPSAPRQEIGELHRFPSREDDVAPQRVYRFHSAKRRPAEWQASSSPDRMKELVRWDRESLYPQHHVLTGQAVLDSPTTIPNREWQSLIDVGRELGVERSDKVPDALLRTLGVRHRITRPQDEKDKIEFHSIANDDSNAENASSPFPRVWAVNQIELLPELTAPTLRDVEERTRKVWFPDEKIRDFRSVGVVESNEFEFPTTDPLNPLESTSSICEYSPHEVVVQATVSTPALVILSDQFHLDWHAEVRRSGESTWTQQEILRTNRVLRGVWLSAPGEYEIRYRFQSGAFELGTWISGTMWVCLLFLWTLRRMRS